jgi:hypothetical protein
MPYRQEGIYFDPIARVTILATSGELTMLPAFRCPFFESDAPVASSGLSKRITAKESQLRSE